MPNESSVSLKSWLSGWELLRFSSKVKRLVCLPGKVQPAGHFITTVTTAGFFFFFFITH